MLRRKTQGNGGLLALGSVGQEELKQELKVCSMTVTAILMGWV